MPALNISFTDDEIARLRDRARAEGVSMRTLAHDAVVSSAEQADQDARIAAAYERIKRLSANLLRRLADQ